MNKISLLKPQPAVILTLLRISLVVLTFVISSAFSANSENSDNLGSTPNSNQTYQTQNFQINHEKILDYNSYIKIHEDSSIEVTETITLKSKAQKIKHGIYRDFPTGSRPGSNSGFEGGG